MAGGGHIVLDHPIPTAEPLSVAGQPIWQRHDVFDALMRRESGPELADVFCAPLGRSRAWTGWYVGHTVADPLQPAPDLAASALSELVARLKSTLGLLDVLRKRWGDAGTPDHRIVARCLDRLCHVPGPECVLFNGTDLRILQWAAIAGHGQGHDQPLLRLMAQRSHALPQTSARQIGAQEVMDALGRVETRRTMHRAGTGTATVTLIWHSDSDLDLHVGCPDGEEINFGNREACGGVLDVDMNAGSVVSRAPVENVFWDDVPPAGRYDVLVRNFRTRSDGETSTPYEVTCDVCGKVAAFRGAVRNTDGPVHVATFHVFEDGTAQILAFRQRE